MRLSFPLVAGLLALFGLGSGCSSPSSGTHGSRSWEDAPSPRVFEAQPEGGIKKAEVGNLDGAIADFNRALAKDPENLMALVCRGYAKQNNGDSDGAVTDFNRALALDSRCVPAYVGRAMARSGLGDEAGSSADFDRAIALKPRDPFIFTARGEVRRTRGDLKGAAEDAQRALDLDPNLAGALGSRATARRDTGDLAGALADYNQMILLCPTDTAAYNNRGIVKWDQGDLDGARADFEQALKIYPTNSFAYCGIGGLEFSLGNFAAAQKAYERAIQAEPWRAKYVLFFLTLALRRQNLDETPVQLGKAVSNWSGGWTKTIGRFLLGEIAEKGLLDSATRGSPRKIREQRCEAYYYAGMIRLLRNDRATAKGYFEQCIGTGVATFQEYRLARAELARL